MHLEISVCHSDHPTISSTGSLNPIAVHIDFPKESSYKPI